MKRNILTILCTLIVSHAFAYDFEVDGIYYNILSEEDKTVEVMYKDENYESYSGDVVINNTVNYYNNIYTVTSIGSYAFIGCDSLTSITIPNSVTSIGRQAFYYCSGLTSITIPNSVDSIGLEAFADCYSLTSATIQNGVTSIVDYMFVYCSNLTNITIPNSVTIIGNSAFEGCRLRNITIPNSVTSIGSRAFAFSGLTSITIPNSVDSIGLESFEFCCSLNNINIGAKSISSRAFFGCSELTSITIQNGVASIGSNAFDRCEKLTSLTIQNGVTYIGSAAFGECMGLTSITVPNSVTYIGSDAFYNCSGLTSITIPNSVTYIGRGAFLGCSGLTDVTNFSTIPQTISSVTFPIDGITLHVLPGYGDEYRKKEYWRDFLIKEDAVLPIEEVSAETYAISDGSSYNSEVRTTSDNLSYSRTFNNTTWQALYVPFSIPVSKLTEAGLVVAELNDTHQRDYNSDGVADSTWIEFFTLQSGSTEANYPYLIKANEPKSVTINLEDVTVEPAESVSIECSTTRQRFTFTGTYDGVSGSEMYSKNYYALAGGSLKRAASSNASIKPQRWYMTIENKNGTTPSYFAPSMRIIVDGIEDETTSIESVLGQSGDSHAYSITGYVHYGNLNPGMYVQNGKKIIVK